MKVSIEGIKEKDFVVDTADSLTMKLAMLFEGHCTIGVQEAIKKYDYSEQRYYQLLKKYLEGGSEALINKKPGPDVNTVRTNDFTNQFIRLRYLDPLASTDIISQKLSQIGCKMSKRSVERIITKYGLQKKRMF